MKTFLFVFCIFISIWWGFVNIAKFIRGHAISAANFIIMSASLTGVITHIIGIW